MAEVRIADIIERPRFQNYTSLRTLELLAFLQSGIIVTSPELSNFALTGRGKQIEIPHWNPLDVNSEPDISSDDPSQKSTPDKISTGLQTAYKNFLAKSWSTMDIVSSLMGQDPAVEIADQIASYWAVNIQKRAISSAVGVIADNVANDASDMGIDITGQAAEADRLLDGDVILDAKQTLGDRAGVLTRMAMHSVHYTNLQKAERISFLKDAPNMTEFGTYNGLGVVIDDSMPVVDAGGGNFDYTVMLFGQGAFSMGIGSAKRPEAVDRDEASGNGSGQETLYTRREFFIHPNGFDYAAGSQAGLSPTRAELELAANWDRKLARKRIPLAFIKCRG